MWTVFLFGCERPNANIQFPAMSAYGASALSEAYGEEGALIVGGGHEPARSFLSTS